MKSLLKIENLTVGYNRVPVLENINFEAKPSEIIAISGFNGTGKSTLFKTIMGIIEPIDGNIFYQSTLINSLDLKERRKSGINLAPEGRKIFPNLNVEENIMIGMSITHWKESERKKRMAEVYEIFPKLRERRKQLGQTLSGGEQQMLSIARALVSKPGLLMLDEPTLGISPVIIDDIVEKIGMIAQTGVCFLIADQRIDYFDKILTQKLMVSNRTIKRYEA